MRTLARVREIATTHRESLELLRPGELLVLVHDASVGVGREHDVHLHQLVVLTILSSGEGQNDLRGGGKHDKRIETTRGSTAKGGSEKRGRDAEGLGIVAVRMHKPVFALAVVQRWV